MGGGSGEVAGEDPNDPLQRGRHRLQRGGARFADYPAATRTPRTATFEAGANTWDIGVPSKFSGNAFLGGAAFQVATALPGGINPVTWTASFSSDTPGVSLNWQWAAAVYTSFSDYSALGVKPL